MCRQFVVEWGFVWGIGAVVLWVVCGWNWCGEPSQALRASSPGGRAKALSRALVCATMEGFIYALASQGLCDGLSVGRVKVGGLFVWVYYTIKNKILQEGIL